MLIARINLGLDVTKAELTQESNGLKRKGIKPTKGTAHRHFVREVFRRDWTVYVRRIRRLVDRAAEAGATIVQLPAISLVVDDRVTLENYGSAFPAKSFVVAGLFDATELGHKGDTREGSVVIQNGGVLNSFPTDHCEMSACSGRLDNLCTIVAVSSTVTDVRDAYSERTDWFGGENGADRRVLVLDLGHEQYTGRYKRTLASVHRHLSNHWGSEPVVVLAQWRYAGSSGRDKWLVATCCACSKRLDSEEDCDGPFHDEIDLITIPGW